MKTKSFFREVLSTSLYLLVVLCLTYLLVTFVGQRTQVNGDSMQPMLANSDHLIVDKITYRFSQPKRFDIIVFSYQYAKDTYYIKRIVGLPGERIRIDDEGHIFINDEILQESYGKEVMKSPGLARDTVTLAEDEYFVLGDNRNDSSDSRDPTVANIHRSAIVGRAWLRIWPFSHFGILKHR